MNGSETTTSADGPLRYHVTTSQYDGQSTVRAVPWCGGRRAALDQSPTPRPRDESFII